MIEEILGKCLKCPGTRLYRDRHVASNHGFSCGSKIGIGEHLCFRCKTCGFAWFEPFLLPQPLPDPVPEPKPEPKCRRRVIS